MTGHRGPASSTRSYRLASAERLVPALTPAEFGAGREGHVSALGPGRFPLGDVRCHAIATDDCGHPRLQAVSPRDVPIQRPIGMPDQGPGFLAAVAHPALTVSRLHGAVCVPGGIVLRDDAVLLNSHAATWDTGQHRHMHRVDGGWRLNPDRAHDPAALPVIDLPVLHLDHQHLDWFGHVLADLLSPGWAYEHCRAFLGVGRLLVLCSVPRYAFVERLILALGVPREDVVLIDRPVLCRQLLVATKALQIQEYASPPAARLFAGMRNRMAGAAPEPTGRIYVSRRANPTRRLVEEEAVEAVFVSFGFRVVHPEAHDIRDQVRIFAGATLIAGCSGSNLFNIAFQARARAILVLVSPLLVHYSEQLLNALHGRAALDVVVGHTTAGDRLDHPGSVHAPWHLHPAPLRDVVAEWLSRTDGDGRNAP